MKVVNAVIKVLVALAAVAGAVYVIATYGEDIVAWAKKVLKSMSKCRCCKTVEVPAEEFEPEADFAEAADAEEAAPAEDAPVEDSDAEGSAVVADESDFEG